MSGKAEIDLSVTYVSWEVEIDLSVIYVSEDAEVDITYVSGEAEMTYLSLMFQERQRLTYLSHVSGEVDIDEGEVKDGGASLLPSTLLLLVSVTALFLHRL